MLQPEAAQEKIAVIYMPYGGVVGVITEALNEVGYEVHHYMPAQGEDAVAFIQDKKPALVIASHMQGETPDGLGMLRTARQTGAATVAIASEASERMTADEIQQFNSAQAHMGRRTELFRFDSPFTETALKGLMRTVRSALGNENMGADEDGRPSVASTVKDLRRAGVGTKAMAGA